MPRKPAEIVTETHKVVSIAIHPAETHGGVLLMVEGLDVGLVVDNAKFYVPDGSKVNLWKLIQWFTEAKGVTVEVDRLVKKDLKVKEVRFSVPELPNQKEEKEKAKPATEKVKPKSEEDEEEEVETEVETEESSDETEVTEA